MNNGIKEELENKILPAYLLKNKWFKGSSRSIYSCSINNHIVIDLDDIKAYLLLVEVNYQNGLPETYQVAITITKDEKAKELRDNYPESILSHVKMRNKEWFLCDAFYTQEFRNFLIYSIANNLKRVSLEFEGKEVVKNYARKNVEILSKMHPGDD